MEIPTDGSFIIHKDAKLVVVLPCFGAPYVFGIYDHKNKAESHTANFQLLKKAVMGCIESYDRKGFVIHPMFCEENPRWALAQRLLNCRWTKVYVNENGGEDCAVNTGTIIANPHRRLGGCPHLFGDVALVVNKRTFEVLCPHIGAMTLHKNPETSGEGENGAWEFEDDEDMQKHIAEFREKGYDFNEHNGFCYKRPIVGVVPPVYVAPMD
jgi:hypothetical protein